MKLAAITNRGSKKDFYDLNKLLQLFTLKQILGFYLEKFKDSSIFFALKSLIYFDDAEEQETPLMFDEITWDQVKKNIVDAHLDYLNNY
jgi:predicted nucleotidyltransferase component of viral defense system